MMRHILIPTDFSETANSALLYALELALATKAECTLLHAYKMPHDFVAEMENRVVAHRKNAVKKLEAYVEELKKEEKYAGLKLHQMAKEGSPAEVVEDLSEEIAADLVVIGLSRNKGWNTFFSGGKGEEIVENCRLPVLAVPAGVPFQKPREIVYAAAYREEDMQNLEELAGFAKLFDARLRIVHVIKKDTKEERLRYRGFSEEVQDTLSYPYLNQELLIADEVEEGLQQAIANSAGVVLSMAHYHKSFFKGMFAKNHTKEVAKETRVPLMVFYEEE
ncbi:universal stress protein [Nafulsella turpanensis]|uniref:universal stress protein n=1 Tax=Nafulsella turpanensis TaxID=1265690 RepID=UPI00034B387C|nr:universal stress protein [Nafulsella turpanensis]